MHSYKVSEYKFSGGRGNFTILCISQALTKRTWLDLEKFVNRNLSQGNNWRKGQVQEFTAALFILAKSLLI